MVYTLISSDAVRRDSDGATIPIDPKNRDYAEFLAWQAKGGTPASEIKTGPSTDEVNAERNRRIVTAFVFDGKPYDNDEVSKQRITGAATLAGFAMAAGKQPGDLLWHGGTAPFTWIAADNTLTTMDAPTCFRFGQQCAAHETRMIFFARALKETRPIPADYKADKYWS